MMTRCKSAPTNLNRAVRTLSKALQTHAMCYYSGWRSSREGGCFDVRKRSILKSTQELCLRGLCPRRVSPISSSIRLSGTGRSTGNLKGKLKGRLCVSAFRVERFYPSRVRILLSYYSKKVLLCEPVADMPVIIHIQRCAHVVLYCSIS